MNLYLKTTGKIIAVLTIGFFANFLMTRLAAPGHVETAMAVGLLLTSFGFMLAKFSMEIVMLPIAAFSLLLHLVQGNKIKLKSDTKNDRIDFFGRLLFVAAYGFISGIVGIFIGVMDGGMGWLTTTALFAIVGLGLAIAVPMEMIWADGNGDATDAEPTAVGQADREQARREGVPSVLLADKVAKKVIDTLFEKPDTHDKS